MCLDVPEAEGNDLLGGDAIAFCRSLPFVSSGIDISKHNSFQLAATDEVLLVVYVKRVLVYLPQSFPLARTRGHQPFWTIARLRLAYEVHCPCCQDIAIYYRVAVPNQISPYGFGTIMNAVYDMCR